MVEMVICLYGLFMAIGNNIYDTMENPDTIESSNDRLFNKIQMACRPIEENCQHNITLENVSEYIGFSPYYFSRSFKKITHYNFVEYLTMQRVKHLQALLTDNEILLTDAAYQVGFKSISTLNRVFK